MDYGRIDSLGGWLSKTGNICYSIGRNWIPQMQNIFSSNSFYRGEHTMYVADDGTVYCYKCKLGNPTIIVRNKVNISLVAFW